MKCENCGKDEVNFHFTSNINGNITEKHLCTDCASALGYTEKNVPQPEMSFEDAFTELFGGKPNRRMFGGFGMMIPTFIIPTIGLVVSDDKNTQSEPQPSPAPTEVTGVIDEEMKLRRELNVLREQMRSAAEEENYEKAAVLRDSIRRLENKDRI